MFRHVCIPALAAALALPALAAPAAAQAGGFVPVAVGGASGTPGAGSLTLPAVIPNDPLYAGRSISMQVGFNDAGAVAGASLSQGLRMEIF